MTNQLTLGSGLRDWALRRQEGVHGPLDWQLPPTGEAIREHTAAALVAAPPVTTQEDEETSSS